MTIKEFNTNKKFKVVSKRRTILPTSLCAGLARMQFHLQQQVAAGQDISNRLKGGKQHPLIPKWNLSGLDNAPALRQKQMKAEKEIFASMIQLA